MPMLPSGLRLALWENAIFEPGENWFKCPEGHFWYHIAAPEMGEPLFEKNQQVWVMPIHAKAPHTHEEAKCFVEIIEMEEDGSGVWRGEWLADFPKYRTLSDADKTAWEAWLQSTEVLAYLDRIIARCSEAAVMAKAAQGYFLTQNPPQIINATPETKMLGEHPEFGGPVTLRRGRFGPYVTHNKINATIPATIDPANITLNQAIALIAERAAKMEYLRKRKGTEEIVEAADPPDNPSNHQKL